MKFEELIKIAYQIDADLFGEIRTSDLLKYLTGEVEELKEADQKLQIGYDHTTRFNQIEELGDITFCILAYARQQDIDINQALSLTLTKLRDRLKAKNERRDKISLCVYDKVKT